MISALSVRCASFALTADSLPILPTMCWPDHCLGRITASMSEPDPRPFSGLFDLTSPGVGRDLNRRFVEADLNDSVRSLVAYLDRVFSVATDPGWVFLTTIENDAVAGRFPEVLRNFFDWEPWSDSTRYFVAPMGQLTVEPEAVVGRITFESPPGHLIQVLAYNDGFCWGANLSVGGVQVREGDVTQAVALNPFSVDDARQLESLARLAWAASRDLDEFGLNASAGHEHLLARLDQIRTA